MIQSRYNLFCGGDIVVLTLYWHPRCNSCRKAKKWLEEHDYELNLVHISENPPSTKTLLDIYEKSGLDLKKFISTSSRKYREAGVKEKIKAATTAKELFSILTTDGTLIKRPIVTDGQKVTVGYNEEVFQSVWG